MISVIPFRARHMREIRPDADDKMMALALTAQNSGPAFTGFLWDKAIGAAGVAIQKPGVGEAWTIFNPAMGAFPLFMHREVKTRLNKVIESLDEVYAVCSGDDRWLKRLGFHVSQLDDPQVLQKLEPHQTLYVRQNTGGRR